VQEDGRGPRAVFGGPAAARPWFGPQQLCDLGLKDLRPLTEQVHRQIDASENARLHVDADHSARDPTWWAATNESKPAPEPMSTMRSPSERG
jgi:hypothetical protein